MNIKDVFMNNLGSIKLNNCKTNVENLIIKCAKVERKCYQLLELFILSFIKTKKLKGVKNENSSYLCEV